MNRKTAILDIDGTLIGKGGDSALQAVSALRDSAPDARSRGAVLGRPLDPELPPSEFSWHPFPEPPLLHPAQNSSVQPSQRFGLSSVAITLRSPPSVCS